MRELLAADVHPRAARRQVVEEGEGLLQVVASDAREDARSGVVLGRASEGQPVSAGVVERLQVEGRVGAAVEPPEEPASLPVVGD